MQPASQQTNFVTLERQDEIKCRGKRPHHDKFRGTTSLHFGGRVKATSKKNAQLEYKMKLDGKIVPIFQHGKFNEEIFIVDYGYPLAPVQAFALALGLHNFTGKMDKQS